METGQKLKFETLILPKGKAVVVEGMDLGKSPLKLGKRHTAAEHFLPVHLPTLPGPPSPHGDPEKDLCCALTWQGSGREQGLLRPGPSDKGSQKALLFFNILDISVKHDQNVFGNQTRYFLIKSLANNFSIIYIIWYLI